MHWIKYALKFVAYGDLQANRCRHLPSHVRRADKIERLIDEWAGTHDLDDSDFDDHSDHENDSHISISSCESEEVVPSVPRFKTVIVCAVHTDTPAHCHNAHGANNFDILNNLSQAFDLEMPRFKASKSFTPKTHSCSPYANNSRILNRPQSQFRIS